MNKIKRNKIKMNNLKMLIVPPPGENTEPGGPYQKVFPTFEILDNPKLRVKRILK